MAAQIASFLNYDFPSLCENKDCKREEKYKTGNRICY
jgi:hypothetical protein